MIISVKTIIKNFDYPYFVSAFVRGKTPEALKISKQNGIKCTDTISACLQEFRKFSERFDYSRESVESYFGVKFINVRIEKSKIVRFESERSIGHNIIFIHQK